MRLPNLGNLLAGTLPEHPGHRLRPCGRRTPILPTDPYGRRGMKLVLSRSDSLALMEATTVVCGFALQDRV